MCTGNGPALAAEVHPHWELAVQVAAALGGGVNVGGSCPVGGQ